jgi:hypothetical protein
MFCHAHIYCWFIACIIWGGGGEKSPHSRVFEWLAYFKIFFSGVDLCLSLFDLYCGNVVAFRQLLASFCSVNFVTQKDVFT